MGDWIFTQEYIDKTEKSSLKPLIQENVTCVATSTNWKFVQIMAHGLGQGHNGVSISQEYIDKYF